jgi:hypothetical protein
MIGGIEMVGVGLLYVALTILTFLRVWPHFQTQVITRSVYDFGTNLWLQWWGPYALAHGMNPFYTRWLFHPVGSALTVDAWTVPWLMLWPFRHFLTPVGGYNLLAAFSYVSTGLASYAFFRLFSKSRSGSLLASFIFTFSAYRNYSFIVSHSELLQTQGGVLMILAYIVYLRGAWSRRNALWLLAAAAFAAYSEMRTFLTAMMLIGAYSVFAALQRRRAAPEDAAALFRKWLAFCLAAAILAAPLIIEIIRATGWYETLEGNPVLRIGWRDVLFPPVHHALGLFYPAGTLPGTWSEHNEGYINLVVLSLALLGLAKARGREEDRPWALALAVFAVLEAARWPLIYLPFLTFLRVPARFSAVTILLTGMFACRGWEHLSSRIRAVPLRFMLWAALSVMVVVETNPVFQPLTTVWNIDSPALDALKNRGGGAVLDLPLTFRKAVKGPYNYRAYLRAARHEKPLVNGNLSLRTIPVLAQISQDKDVQTLLACQWDGACGSLKDAFWDGLRRSKDIRYVISEKTGPQNPLAASIRRSGALRIIDSDAEIDIYEIR